MKEASTALAPKCVSPQTGCNIGPQMPGYYGFSGLGFRVAVEDTKAHIAGCSKPVGFLLIETQRSLDYTTWTRLQKEKHVESLCWMQRQRERERSMHNTLDLLVALESR